MQQELGHFIKGKRTAARSNGSAPIYNPGTGEVIRQVGFATPQEIDECIASARAAFPGWRDTPPATRGKILAKFRNLIDKHEDELARLVGEEHGKSMVEAKGSISRGVDVLDFATNIASHLKTDYCENVGRGVDCYSIRQPLGVIVGITPFNFPAMIPLWTGAIALATGNCFILKPSERDPSCPLRMAELAHEAGIPEGVFNVIQGDKDCVNHLLRAPGVDGISFVGQTSTAKYIQETAIQHHKRVQAFGGAKNHMLVMPDADLDKTVDALIGAAYGSAGERCMAISVAVVVGDENADRLIAGLTPKVQGLKIGLFDDSNAEMGPLITAEHRKKVLAYVDAGIKEGAKLVIDGRGFKHDKYPDGFYMGGCLFDHVTSEMSIYQQEIFGPVLCVVRVPDYETGLKMINDHPYGNGCAIFTQDGDAARDFQNRVQVGMVGINVPIPVPVAQQSFGGWKDSSFADIGMHGMEGIRFCTKLKTITSRWPSGIRKGVEFGLNVTEKR